MATQKEKFKEIADAIRVKTGKTDKIVADDFASEIMTIDRLKKMTLYPSSFTNGYYGNRAAQIASTYHLARALGTDTFIYESTANTPFSSGVQIRDENGKGKIDCSTFVGFALRGIKYANSPYPKHKTANETWAPSSELSGMYGQEGWEFSCLDKQQYDVFSDIGISGYNTVRTAADLGLFFYQNGYIMFDAKYDGEITKSKAESLQKKLRPGDLIFWSYPNAKESQKKRFRSISHVAIVAEKPTQFFEVTSADLVVLYNDFMGDYEHISLICRPDYRPRQSAAVTPIGVNLLHYPWEYGALKTWTISGITFKVTDEDSIHLSGTNTEQVFHRIKGHEDDGTYLTLSPGTYQLSGMGNVGVTHTGVALQVRKADGTDFSEPIRCYTDNNPTFTISKTTNIIVVFYMGENDGNGYKLNCTINPTLKRIS